jgi:hypothetical protein
MILFAEISRLLSDALSRVTYPLALDNICAAFTRMIIVNISAVPMDQVWDCGKFVCYLSIIYYFPCVL